MCNSLQCHLNIIKYHSIIHHTDNQGNIGGFRRGGRGRGGFGRGRGPVTYHNCQQPGHYARDCPLPPTTCMYYHATDHTTKDCPTLLTKIQEKRNQNNKMFNGLPQKLEKMMGKRSI
jgi:hypothetical protein